jgi:sugar/nucleoside kinase (ribokinase family)
LVVLILNNVVLSIGVAAYGLQPVQASASRSGEPLTLRLIAATVWACMARQRTIVGIGELLLTEHADRVEIAGLAAKFSLAAQRFGHVGVPISRVGQDVAANELLTQLKSAGVLIDHLQSDPDLPTGRMVIRSIAGKTKRTLQPRAAFDNLQWDFDLDDVAQQADAAVFGQLAQRGGQTQSIIRRFLGECGNAIRVFNATNRADDVMDRAQLRSYLEHADGLIADRIALKTLVPSWDEKQPRDAATDLLRGGALAFVVSIEPGDCTQTFTIHTTSLSSVAPRTCAAAQHEIAIVAILHGMINGWDSARSLELACAAAEHAAKNPNEPLPANLL